MRQEAINNKGLKINNEVLLDDKKTIEINDFKNGKF